jgi:hypothetical protein
MKEKLIKIFASLNPENQAQILDYALMLWEMEQGENQLREQLGLGNFEKELNRLNAKDKTDSKNIN